MINIAIIPPLKNSDFLTDTVIDGILDLVSCGAPIHMRILGSYNGTCAEDLSQFFLKESEFIEYAYKADLIFLCFRYKELNTKIVDTINQWHKVVFVDGSEYKHDNRFNFDIQYDTLTNQNSGLGAINNDMYTKAGLYLRREKPYLKNILPFPFGIERRYRNYTDNTKKDIDFVCIFGQDTYPKMRMYCKKILEDFCQEHNFTYRTKQTSGFTFDLMKKLGREEFYDILSRSKVGVSVGGGGFDTLRFWETLGNNDILLTEKIDIYPLDSTRLHYNRIFEFSNLFDFKYQLEKIGDFLRNEYNQESLVEEYKKILIDHSTKSRIIEVLQETQKRNILLDQTDWSSYLN